MGAREKLDNQVTKFYLSDPIMLNVLSMFDKVADPKQETIGIDIRGTKPKITYNPNFINTISGEVLETVLVMEGLKILLGHPTTRLRDPKHITSMSSDITVTEMSKEHFGNILGDNQNYAEKLGLPEKEIFEEYFRLLNNKQEEFNQFVKDNWEAIQQMGQKGEGEGEGDGEGQGQGEPSEGEGQGQGQGGGNDFKEFENESDAMKEYFNPNGTKTDGWGGNEFMEAAIKNMVNDAKDKVKMWGKYTGSAQGEILAANKPKLNWKMLLRSFAKSVTTDTVASSRMKVNRRFDLHSPGHRYDSKCHVLVAIDTSGSMSDADVARGLSVVNSVFNVAKVSYCLWDTEIKEFDNKYNKLKKSFKVTGRGGTNVSLVYDWIKNRKRKDKFDGVIMFSDMYFPAEKDPKIGIPTLWLGTASGDSKCPCDWGTFVKMEME